MSSEQPEDSELRVLLLGKTGAGKSEAGNIILGEKKFEAKMSPASVTTKCQKETREFEGETLAVVDTPGLFHTERSPEEVMKEILQSIMLVSPGPHVLLLVQRAFKFTKLDENLVKAFKKIFEDSKEHTFVLFTHADQRNVEGFIKKHPALEMFLHNSCEGHFVFNNKFDKTDKNQESEVTKLLEKIREKKGSPYKGEMFKDGASALEEAMKLPEVQSASDPEEKVLDLLCSWVSKKVDKLEEIPGMRFFLNLLDDKAYEFIIENQ